MRKLAKKEIHFAWAIGIILVAAIFSATTITAKAWIPWYFGGKITTVQPAGTCSCPHEPACIHGCGCGWSDVGIQPFGGGQAYVCVPASFPVKGRGLSPGLKIFGGGLSAAIPVYIWTVP